MKLWANKLQEMEAQLDEAMKRVEAMEAKRRAAQAAAKAAEKAMKGRMEREAARHTAAMAEREAVVSATLTMMKVHWELFFSRVGHKLFRVVRVGDQNAGGVGIE